MSTYTIRIEDTDGNENVKVSLEFEHEGMDTESPAFQLAAYAIEMISSLNDEPTVTH